MRSWFFRAVTIILVLCLTGCAAKAPDLVKPAPFYYCTAASAADASAQVFGSEQRETQGYGDSLQKLLNAYFQGPVDPLLTSPFPRNLRVKEVKTLGNTIRLLLSDELSQLTGVDLTVACTCLAATVFSVSEMTRVEVRISQGLLDGRDVVIISRTNVLTADNSALTDSNNAATEPTS